MEPEVKQNALRWTCHIIYLWLCIFMIPALKELFHELGHAAYLLGSCGVEQVQISLGSNKQCLPDGKSLTICVYPVWIFKSLYRESLLHVSPTATACNGSIWLKLMGGIFGLIFPYFLTVLGVATVWAIRRRPWKETTLAAFSFFMVPYYWIQSIQITSVLDNVLIGFGALVMEFDMINEVMYTILPTRSLKWEYNANADGSKVWELLGVSDSAKISASYFSFFLIWISYIVATGFYIMHVVVCKRRAYIIQHGMDPEEKEAYDEMFDDDSWWW